MKRKLLLFVCSFLSINVANAQWTNNRFWNYNFGTVANSFNTPGTNSTSTSSSSPFLPSPISGNLSVYLNASAASGGFTLTNDNKMLVQLPTASFVRFAGANIPTITDVVVNSFKIKFSPAVTGTDGGNYIYAIGKNAGNLFNATGNNGVNRASNELFTALRWQMVTTPNSAAITFQYRVGSDASTTTTYGNVDQSNTFVKGGEYEVNVYCNNSTSSKTYVLSTVPYILAPGSFHIWVNGTRLTAAGNPDFARSIETNGTAGVGSGTSISFPAGDPLHSFLFAGNGAASATGNITLSEIKMTSDELTLPVDLIAFTGKKEASGISLNWKTASEQNNDYFELFRATDGQNYTSLSKIIGKDNSSELSQYQFLDRNPADGYNYYLLKQVDKNGTVNEIKDRVVVKYHLAQLDNFAVSANGNSLNISVNSVGVVISDFYVYDISGKKLTQTKLKLSSGNNRFSLDAVNLPKGALVARLSTPNGIQSVKFLR